MPVVLAILTVDLAGAESKGIGKLLLVFAGEIGVQGKGDVVALCDTAGTEFARGLTNYSAADAQRIRGLRTEQIGEVLGTLPYEEVVHRDNLVVTI